MTAADWVGIAALAVAPALAFVGVVYRAGQLTNAIKDLDRRVSGLEDSMRRRPQRG